MIRDRTVDVVRGAVMVLMAIDHVQEYQAGPGRGLITDPIQLGVTPWLVYVFRILSHFCAPVFALLMGLSAGLRGKSSAQLARRGLLLLLLEFTVIQWCWTFHPLWHRYFFQIIGALGVSLLLLSAAVRLPRPVVVFMAAAILCLHNLFDAVRFDPASWEHYVWSFLHQKNVLPLWAGYSVRTTYPVLPVFGVVLLGYALAPWMADGEKRRRLAPPGVAFCLIFAALRAYGGYGDASRFEPGAYAVASFFNVTKYPMSLHYVLMTLGPALVLLSRPRIHAPWLERLGRSPMFFYVAHLALIHAVALGASVLAGYRPDMRNFGWIGDGFGFPVWATAPFGLLVCAALYPFSGGAGMRIKLGGHAPDSRPHEARLRGNSHSGRY